MVLPPSPRSPLSFLPLPGRLSSSAVYSGPDGEGRFQTGPARFEQPWQREGGGQAPCGLLRLLLGWLDPCCLGVGVGVSFGRLADCPPPPKGTVLILHGFPWRSVDWNPGWLNLSPRHRPLCPSASLLVATCCRQTRKGSGRLGSAPSISGAAFPQASPLACLAQQCPLADRAVPPTSPLEEGLLAQTATWSLWPTQGVGQRQWRLFAPFWHQPPTV